MGTDAECLRSLIDQYDRWDGNGHPARRTLEFAKADFSGEILDGLNLENVNFCRAKMRNTVLTGAKVVWSSFIGADLCESSFNEVNFGTAFLSCSNFSHARMMRAFCNASSLNASNFKYAHLQDANLTAGSFMISDFRQAFLCRANCTAAKFDLADFRGADLSYVDFSHSSLRGARLGGARILGANFSHSDLTDAKLDGIDITSCNIREWLPGEGFYDVAISFAGEDRAEAFSLSKACQRRGIRVFFTPEVDDRLFGKDMYQYFYDIYNQKTLFVLLLISQSYLRKPWTNHELKAAQSRQFESGREYILPVLISGNLPPGIPKTMGYIDYNKFGAEGIAEVIKRKIDRYNNKHSENAPIHSDPRRRLAGLVGLFHFLAEKVRK